MVRAKGLLSGNTNGVDASTLEANATMKSIVRKATGDSRLGYITKPADEAGAEIKLPEEIRRFNKKRTGKGLSNADCQCRTGPEVRIAKMKYGLTHLAWNAEYAVTLESSALTAAEVSPAEEGDAATLPEIITKVEVHPDHLDVRWHLGWLVADKGCHKPVLLKGFRQYHHLLTCILERANEDKHRTRNGNLQQAFHESRRQCRNSLGKGLMRKRANLIG